MIQAYDLNNLINYHTRSFLFLYASSAVVKAAESIYTQCFQATLEKMTRDKNLSTLCGSLVDPQPGKFCHDMIDSVAGNANISLSKVVFLSDVHSNSVQNVNRQFFINVAAKKNDYYFLEGKEFTPKTGYRLQAYKSLQDESGKKLLDLINQELILNGWEDPILYKEALKVREKIITWHHSKTLYPAEEVAKRGRELSLELDEVVDKRNDFMAKTIHSMIPILNGNQQIFVVAGVNHLNEDLLKRFEGIYTSIFFKE